ncbi:MAG: DUF1080 domain-containing protein [Aureliella sp.]
MRFTVRALSLLCLTAGLQAFTPTSALSQEATATASATAAESTAQAETKTTDPADSKPTLPPADEANAGKVEQAAEQSGDAKQADAVEEPQLPPEPAATKVPDGDPDYALLGEFVGEIEVEESKSTLGLQIRPIGGGMFEAIQFAGGLPGKGAVGKEAIELIGKRFNNSLVLSGGPWVVYASADSCTVLNESGPVGKLTRVTRTSPTMGAQPPKGATVLFDGTNIEQFTKARMTADGLLAEGADVKPMFQDFNLHVEFRLPYMPEQLDQKRGNSGCYLQSRYEVQVLDSFATLPVFNGCSSIYRFKPADVNMCLPPLQWQTYDIIFTAPRWAADGSKIRNARLTVWHNGVKTQDDVELPNKTGAGKVEEPTLLPTRFQDHRDPVRFRNIWIVDRGLIPMAQFPLMPSEASSDAEATEETAETDAT